ncbi:hypothetical protein BDV24DRAFT_130264 [Aspergillus arachidicola]|uniref:Uncharacterized protein n=1 Tax=Aspergillus arachidicola TaxID=656916 RepID=A0A5N6YB52_9EURO|nr:hypothetical protein BDV24DRAFT_130264 [Aspergillus arachidicola]
MSGPGEAKGALTGIGSKFEGSFSNDWDISVINGKTTPAIPFEVPVATLTYPSLQAMTGTRKILSGTIAPVGLTLTFDTGVVIAGPLANPPPEPIPVTGGEAEWRLH